MAKTIIIIKDDVKNVLHPHLWESWLSELDLPKDTTTLICQVIDSEQE